MAAAAPDVETKLRRVRRLSFGIDDLLAWRHPPAIMTRRNGNGLADS
jgi:hypothetical protein